MQFSVHGTSQNSLEEDFYRIFTWLCVEDASYCVLHKIRDRDSLAGARSQLTLSKHNIAVCIEKCDHRICWDHVNRCVDHWNCSHLGLADLLSGLEKITHTHTHHNALCIPSNGHPVYVVVTRFHDSIV